MGENGYHWFLILEKPISEKEMSYFWTTLMATLINLFFTEIYSEIFSDEVISMIEGAAEYVDNTN